MPQSNQTAEKVMLQCQWRQWSAIVASFAGRQFSIPHLGVEGYKTLYREMLRTAAALEAGAVGPDRDLHRRLQEIVRPWVSLDALARADMQILHSVLQETHLAAKQLGVGRSFPWLQWLLTLALGALVVVGVLALARFASETLGVCWRQLLAWQAVVRAALATLTDLQKIVFVCIVLVCAALIVAWRARGRI